MPWHGQLPLARADGPLHYPHIATICDGQLHGSVGFLQCLPNARGARAPITVPLFTARTTCMHSRQIGKYELDMAKTKALTHHVPWLIEAVAASSTPDRAIETTASHQLPDP